jgi:hypothetical protein
MFYLPNLPVFGQIAGKNTNSEKMRQSSIYEFLFVIFIFSF